MVAENHYQAGYRKPDQDDVFNETQADLGAGCDSDADDRDITSITRMTAVLMRMFGHVLVELEPNTARTDGARTTTPEIDPTSVPAIINHPVRKPR